MSENGEQGSEGAGVVIPPIEMVDIESLKTDGDNPNRMTPAKRKALRESIKRFGFIVPVVTNSELLVADDEQRLDEAKKIGLKKIPVVRLPVKDVDRRLLRQVLNKLKGEHELVLDSLEFKRLIEANAGEDAKLLLGLTDKELDLYTKIVGDDQLFIINTGADFKNRWRFTPAEQGGVLVCFGDVGSFIDRDLVDRVKKVILSKYPEDRSPNVRAGHRNHEGLKAVCELILSAWGGDV